MVTNAITAWAICGALWGAWPTGPESVAAQETQYRERQVLDPDSDEWVPSSAPVEGTPQGELELARSQLARSAPRKARAILGKWLKANPDHEQRVEAEFLLGDALFEIGDFWAAFERYNYVAENTGGELYRRAVRRELDVARAFLAGKKRRVLKILRLPAYDSGVEILDKVWAQAPGTRTGEDALRTRADFHYTRGEMDFAQDDYVTLAREYPRGRFTQYAMMRSAESANAAFEGVKFDDRPLLEAEERYKQVQNVFPAYAERERVADRLAGIREARASKDLDIGRWYVRTNRPDAAAFYFRRVRSLYAGTLAADEATGALRRLGVDIEQESP